MLVRPGGSGLTTVPRLLLQWHLLLLLTLLRTLAVIILLIAFLVRFWTLVLVVHDIIPLPLLIAIGLKHQLLQRLVLHILVLLESLLQLHLGLRIVSASAVDLTLLFVLTGAD